jgi:hypothetical protein
VSFVNTGDVLNIVVLFFRNVLMILMSIVDFKRQFFIFPLLCHKEAIFVLKQTKN